MLAVALVVVGALLWLELVRQLGEHDVADGVDRGREVGAAVPDLDEVAVEATGEAAAADVVAFRTTKKKHRQQTPDPAIPGRKEGKEKAWEKWGECKKLTGKHDLTHLLADGQEQDLLPEVGAERLVDAEGPAAAALVAGVFPHGPHAVLEEMNAVAQLEVGEGEVVEHLHEGFDGGDVVEEGGETGGVLVGNSLGGGGGGGGGDGGGGGGRRAFVVESPRVGEGGGAEFSQDCLEGEASVARFGGGGGGGGCGVRLRD